MIRSLRLRLMLAAMTLAVLFMLALLPAMQGAFSLALQESIEQRLACLLYTSPSPRDGLLSRMPSSA